MDKPKAKPATKSKPGRLSLYGMTPEDALRRALTTPPPKSPDKPPARSKAKIKQKRKTG